MSLCRKAKLIKINNNNRRNCWSAFIAHFLNYISPFCPFNATDFAALTYFHTLSASSSLEKTRGASGRIAKLTCQNRIPLIYFHGIEIGSIPFWNNINLSHFSCQFVCCAHCNHPGTSDNATIGLRDRGEEWRTGWPAGWLTDRKAKMLLCCAMSTTATPAVSHSKTRSF